VRGNDRDNVRDRRTRWGCAIRYFWALLYIEIMGTKQKTTRLLCLGWTTWDDAVKHAEEQKHATRLSNTAGFNNQGYYVHPEK